MVNRKHTKQELDSIPRQLEAYKARMLGFTYRDIAASLGYKHPSGAKYAVQAVVKRAFQETGADYRTLGFDRLELMLQKAMPRAIACDMNALRAVVHIVNSEAAMMGANIPVQQNLKVDEKSEGKFILEWDLIPSKSSKSPKPTNELKEPTEPNPPLLPGGNE
jgi:hypothetical protein